MSLVPELKPPEILFCDHPGKKKKLGKCCERDEMSVEREWIALVEGPGSTPRGSRSAEKKGNRRKKIFEKKMRKDDGAVTSRAVDCPYWQAVEDMSSDTTPLTKNTNND